ncbi:hypothetical protein [Methylobacterium sp. Leaf93]|uniref:hypothetical protein n=1 Tax=Methylobacterium sp. Leaf93 TaxID=1736249 RepID=UPI000A783AE3|nr:hypothetical protein [Methylobacterium sp. Leaf93]
MRTSTIITAACLILSASITTAQARFKGGRSISVSHPAPSITPARSAALGAGIGAARPVRAIAGATENDTTAGHSVTLRPVLPVPAPAAKEVRSAASWCVDKRVVGTGAGFCEIN